MLTMRAILPLVTVMTNTITEHVSLASTGNQHLWYWICRISVHFVSTKKVECCEIIWKCMSPNFNSAQQGVVLAGSVKPLFNLLWPLMTDGRQNQFFNIHTNCPELNLWLDGSVVVASVATFVTCFKQREEQTLLSFNCTIKTRQSAYI